MDHRQVGTSGRHAFRRAALFRDGWYRAGSSCYAWMVPNGSWGETNIGLVERNGQNVLVDTCWDVRLRQGMLSFAGDVVARSPIEYVINTHADGDHC